MDNDREDGLGLALANHTLVIGLSRLLKAKGLLTQQELDGVVHDSLTVLETAVPDRDSVRAARVVLEHMLAPQPARARSLDLTTTD